MIELPKKKVQSVINTPCNTKSNELLEIKKRNKNMMNNLLSHLNKAKEKLQHDTPIIQKQEIITKKAEELSKQTESLVKDKHMAVLLEQKESLQDDYNSLENKITICQSEINSLLKRNYEHNLSNYIPTKTRPMLFWKPMKSNDIITQFKDSVSQNNKNFNFL